jgi:hypothetical protein
MVPRVTGFDPGIGATNNRYICTESSEVEKAWYKPVLDSAKLSQTQDGAWGFEIMSPLEAGHYLVTFQKVPMRYWDFVVK